MTKEVNTNPQNQAIIAGKQLYSKCGTVFSAMQKQTESIEYGACSFMLNQQNIQYRESKITPTKTGQFVTIWKRNPAGITTPFSANDNIDFMIITCKNDKNLGQFIFPKSILLQKAIMSDHCKQGKRGMRVYPPWDVATNAQAIKSQQWQCNYFINLLCITNIEIEKFKQIFFSVKTL
jgi:hypothetical protein